MSEMERTLMQNILFTVSTKGFHLGTEAATVPDKEQQDKSTNRTQSSKRKMKWY